MKSISIKKWLLEKGLTQADIARSLNVSRSLVGKVIKGERQNSQVIHELRLKGCPEKYLGRQRARAAGQNGQGRELKR
ncbi:MAG: helix-turn-helix transcriptional regulator [Syntrophobacteraceae bacterium]|jgi:transcriptional regulator with XRE-family HTH domain